MLLLIMARLSYAKLVTMKYQLMRLNPMPISQETANDLKVILKQIIKDYQRMDDPILFQERMDANITDAEMVIAKAKEELGQ